MATTAYVSAKDEDFEHLFYFLNCWAATSAQNVPDHKASSCMHNQLLLNIIGTVAFLCYAKPTLLDVRN